MGMGTIQKAVSNSAIGTGAKAPGMQDYIKKMEGEIRKALPSALTPERFTRITLSALSGNQKLQETTPQSFLGAMMTAAQLGLEPNTPLGHAYLIPFRNKGVMECQFQLGYKGLIALAYRSGELASIQASVVYEKDEFRYAYGLEKDEFTHIPARKDRGAPICFYAKYRTKDGAYGFEVMSVEDVRAHAQRYSKSYGNGPWQTNFEEMAKKTVLKKVLKYAPLKSDFAKAVARDETIKTELSEDMYAAPATLIETEDYTVDERTGEVTGTDGPGGSGVQDASKAE